MPLYGGHGGGAGVLAAVTGAVVCRYSGSYNVHVRGGGGVATE
jgi:hypothetical protein